MSDLTHNPEEDQCGGCGNQFGNCKCHNVCQICDGCDCEIDRCNLLLPDQLQGYTSQMTSPLMVRQTNQIRVGLVPASISIPSPVQHYDEPLPGARAPLASVDLDFEDSWGAILDPTPIPVKEFNLSTQMALLDSCETFNHHHDDLTDALKDVIENASFENGSFEKECEEYDKK